MAPFVSHLYLYVLGVLMVGSLARCDFIKSHFRAYMPGDIVLGVVESVHAKVNDLENRTSPRMYTCTGFDLIPFVASLVAFHTIEEINNSSFLPGIKLGYLMCDACVYGTRALECVERMLAINGPPTLLPDYSNFTSPIKAFVGERYSELSLPIAKLLSLYMIPQISSTSTAPALSDKLRYASFFRVVPSDVYQTKALVKLMSHYSWTWVGVVTLDDEYGRAVLENFVQDAQKVQMCIHYLKKLPNYLGSSDIEEKIINVVNQIESSNATVVLLILRPELVQMIFQEMIKRNLSRVWIASDSWSTARFLTQMKDINKVGYIFGFTFVTRDIIGFADYVRDIRPSPGAWNDLITEYKQMRPDCTQSQQSQNPLPLFCNNTNDDSFLLDTVDLTQAYGQRVAVYAIAHAIKKLLNCNDTSCSEDSNFLPWKLTSILRNMKFTVDNQTYFFNKEGDFENGYDLIMWKQNGDERIIEVVGTYLISNNSIDVYEQKISWFNNTVAESRCSKKCPKGTYKLILNVTCCYTCVKCAPGEYSDKEDQPTCTKCLNKTSSSDSTKCVEWDVGILAWSSAYSIVVMIGTALGILLLVSSMIFFFKYRQHNIVKLSFKLICIMHAGLVVSFVSVITFLDYPNPHLCMLQQSMYGLGFTLTVACILVQAFGSFIAVLSYDPNRQLYLSRFNRSFVNIAIITAIQGLICLFWFIFDPLKVEQRQINSTTIAYLCVYGSKMVGFAMMHIYIAVLAVCCFLFAFRGRERETEPIVFSMLFHLFAWLCFVPFFVTLPDKQPIIQISSIMLSNYAVMLFHFSPKWLRIFSEIRERQTHFSHADSRNTDD